MITNIVKRVIRNTLDTRYHYKSNQVAKKALKNIEKDQNAQLPKALKKKADKYALEVLGWKGYAPWLHVYTAISGEFKEGWLPDNYYGRIIIPKIQGEYGKTSFLKPLTNFLFHKDLCPDIAYYINGFWFSKSYEVISQEEVMNLIDREKEKIVFKSDNSYQGKGVFVFSTSNINFEEIKKIGNGVLQEFIEQHSFFANFGSEAVSTLRLTTVIDEKGIPSVRASLVRFGRRNDTHVVTYNQIAVAVDIDTGELAEKGYYGGYKSTLVHLDSQIPFAGKRIPFFNKCKELVLALQAEMPMIRTIGWDLVINDKDEPVIMEWNGYGSGIAFTEATQGPSFVDLKWDKLSS